MSEDESTSLRATQAAKEDYDMEDTIECDICGTEMPLRYSTLGAIAVFVGGCLPVRR